MVGDWSTAVAKVPYVVVRRLALARAIAIEHVHMTGKDWSRLSRSGREKVIAHIEERITEWARSGLLIQFAGDYREADGGGDPLVDWRGITRH